MLFRHPAHPGKAVRLAYCLNLHPADTLAGLFDGLRQITLPLRARLAPGREFGVGLYLPARLALPLAESSAEFARLEGFLHEHGLDPFTCNAFPYGGFGEAGLKARVFEPTWLEPERLAYTCAVARIAARLASPAAAPRRLSISTHCGAHVSHFKDAADRREKQRGFAAAFAAAAAALESIGREYGVELVLALEPEPRSNCNDTAEANALLRRTLERFPEAGRVLGTCLDTCHAAVEFEHELRALDLANQHGAGIGKLQFTSAIALHEPAANDFGRRALFALAEPRYLHQVTGEGADVVVRAHDIPDVERAWADPDSDWRRCAEWRCHFHVPVDLGDIAAAGLATTRDYADRILEHALGAPADWRRPELHVELETYTWDVLPHAARGAGELVDGLEREYRHVLALLASEGWQQA